MYEVASGNPIQSSDINQFATVFAGTADPGAVVFLGETANPDASPAASVTTTGGNPNGTYQYVFTFLTGFKESYTGVLHITGETAPSPASAAITTGGAFEIDVSSIATGTVGVIGRNLYRTKASGTVYYLVDTLPNNTQTTFTDNVADSALGVQAPTSNTTGASVTLPYLSVTQDVITTLSLAKGLNITGGNIDVPSRVIDLTSISPDSPYINTNGDLVFPNALTGDYWSIIDSSGGTALDVYVDGTKSVITSGTLTSQAGIHITGLDSNSRALDLTSITTSAPFMDSAGSLHFPNSLSGSQWDIWDKNSVSVFGIYTDGTKAVKTANNTLDAGSGAATFAGSITANAGLTVTSGQTLTITGTTVTGAPTWSSGQTMPSLTTAGSVAAGSFTASTGNTIVDVLSGATGYLQYGGVNVLAWGSSGVVIGDGTDNATFFNTLGSSWAGSTSFPAYPANGQFAMGEPGGLWSWSFATSNAGQTAWVERMRFAGNAAQGAAGINIYEPVNITGDWLGNGLTVTSTTGAGLVLNKGSTGDSSQIIFQDTGVTKWYLGAIGTDNFTLQDNTTLNEVFTVEQGAPANALTLLSSGELQTQEGLQITSSGSSHSFTWEYDATTDSLVLVHV